MATNEASYEQKVLDAQKELFIARNLAQSQHQAEHTRMTEELARLKAELVEQVPLTV